MSAVRRMQQWATFARTWYVFDCTWQDPFASAHLLKSIILGTHKPIHHPMNDCGDVVIAINSRNIAMRGDNWTKQAYFHHTGYPGGATWTQAWELHHKNPTLVLRKAVYRRMTGNLQRRVAMERLLIYPGDNVPEDLMSNVTHQLRAYRQVPQRLDHIPENEVANYPKIMDYPKDYVIKKIR